MTPDHRTRTRLPQRTPEGQSAAIRAILPIAHQQEPTNDVSQATRINRAHLSVGDVLQLQQTVGNRAVSRMLSNAAQRHPRSVRRAPAVAPARGSAGTIQRLIATTADQLEDTTPLGDPLRLRFIQIGFLVTDYNAAAQNNGLAAAARTQRQLDLLRQIDRQSFACFDLISQATARLSADPRAQILHTLQLQAQTEHENLIEATRNSADLTRDVNPLATGGIADMTAAEAKALWVNIMNGQGKIRLGTDAAYNRKVRSWLTKLMDTPKGRQMLRFLNTPDNGRGEGVGDILSNTYISQRVGDLPPGVATAANLTRPAGSPLAIEDKSQATPLRPEDSTTLDAAPALGNGQVENFAATNNVADFQNAVMARAPGVTLGGQRYGFNAQGSGSNVHVKVGDAMGINSGQVRNGAAGEEMPEIYTPKWVTLGHELGHSANMRAGATTPTEAGGTHTAFAEAWSGRHGAERNQFWYQGSEEFLNIEGVENPIRQAVGLSQRGGHTSPQGVMKVRRWGQITNILTNALGGYLNGLADAAVKTGIYTNGFLAIKNHIKDQLNADSRRADFLDLIAMAQRMADFATAWRNLQQAHDGASKKKRFGWYGWWSKSQSSVGNIGQVVRTNDATRYTRKLDRIQLLTRRYLA